MVTTEHPRRTDTVAVLPWNTIDDQPYEPSAEQRAFHEATERYKLFGGSVGPGKTTALAIEALYLSWDHPNNEGVMGRYRFNDLRETLYTEVLKWCPPELIAHHNRSEHWLQLTNGSVIRFKELADPSGLKGPNLGWFAIDQAEEVPYESFYWLQSRLRLPHCDPYYGLLTANPEPGWVKEMFVSQQLSDHVFISALPQSNRHLPADYFDRLRERWPESVVRRLLLGQWDVVENAIYPQLDRAVHLQPLPDGLRFDSAALGVDVGDVHPSAVVAVTRDSLGRYWVRECWTEVGGDYSNLWAAIERMRSRYSVPWHNVRVDPMLKGWEKLTMVTRADASPGSRKNRIEIVTALLNGRPRRILGGTAAQPALFLDRGGAGVDKLFAEMTTYRWQPRETDYMKDLQPVRKDDDRVAALEYAIEALEQPQAIPPRAFWQTPRRQQQREFRPA